MTGKSKCQAFSNFWISAGCIWAQKKHWEFGFLVGLCPHSQLPGYFWSLENGESYHSKSLTRRHFLLVRSKNSWISLRHWIDNFLLKFLEAFCIALRKAFHHRSMHHFLSGTSSQNWSQAQILWSWVSFTGFLCYLGQI